MVVKIAVLLSLASILLGTLVYFLKRRKYSKELPKPQNSAIQANNPKVIQPTPTAPPVAASEPKTEKVIVNPQQLDNIRLMLIAINSPRPTDRTLARHYDEMIEAKTENCLKDEQKMARLIADYEAYQNKQMTEKVAAPAPAQEKPQIIVTTHDSCKCTHVPEDSSLKRHFLTQLRANIEKTKAARPTDCTLRRHYDAMINAEIEKYLAH